METDNNVLINDLVNEDNYVTPFQSTSPDGTNYVLGVKSNGSVVAVPEVHFIRPKWHLPYKAIGYSKDENDFYYYQGRSAVIMNHYGYVKHWIQEENNIQNFRRYENKLGQNRYVYTVQIPTYQCQKEMRDIGYVSWLF